MPYFWLAIQKLYLEIEIFDVLTTAKAKFAIIEKK